MNETIFVIPRHFYQSYTHLYKLIELAEYKTCHPEQIEWESDNCYILTVLNGEIPNPIPEHKCKFIWLSIERPSVYNEAKLGRPDFDELWICDKDWVSRVGGRYFLLGSDARLGYFEPNKKYDIASNCYVTARRQMIFDQLAAAGKTFAPNSFNIPDSEFAASRIQVLPQQDDPPHAITPLRFCIAAAYHMPLLFELNAYEYPFVNQEHFVKTDLAGLVPNAMNMLDPVALPMFQGMGHSLHEFLCIRTNFRKEVEKML